MKYYALSISGKSFAQVMLALCVQTFMALSIRY